MRAQRPSTISLVADGPSMLIQTMGSFRAWRPKARLGRYTGDQKDLDSDVLFASIQTLGRTAHLKRFAPDAFDYIVVDEFHHASARTYHLSRPDRALHAEVSTRLDRDPGSHGWRRSFGALSGQLGVSV